MLSKIGENSFQPRKHMIAIFGTKKCARLLYLCVSHAAPWILSMFSAGVDERPKGKEKENCGEITLCKFHWDAKNHAVVIAYAKGLITAEKSLWKIHLVGCSKFSEGFENSAIMGRFRSVPCNCIMVPNLDLSRGRKVRCGWRWISKGNENPCVLVQYRQFGVALILKDTFRRKIMIILDIVPSSFLLKKCQKFESMSFFNTASMNFSDPSFFFLNLNVSSTNTLFTKSFAWSLR